MRLRTATAVALALGAWLLSLGSAPALAAEAHPFDFSFGAFSNPNGIAVDEASGAVYVADLETNTVYKFDEDGNPANFTLLGSNALTGSTTPDGSFSFPSAEGTPAAITVDNSSGPNSGDVYVMDPGHEAVYRFAADGRYVAGVGSSDFSEHELVGLGTDARGNVRVAVAHGGSADVYVFGSSSGNPLLRRLEGLGGIAHVFATGPVGDSYMRFDGSCGCLAKFGSNGAPFGRVDEGGSDIAAAVDPATRHLYIHEGSSVTEWDTGGMNGNVGFVNVASSGALVSSFGSSQLGEESGQGGMAVNGRSGEIYVSNPADGKVYVFASDTPGVAAGEAMDLARTSATLHGTVNPRGTAVTSCQFEYEQAGSNLAEPVRAYGHAVPCDQSGAQIGAGNGPVAVSADIGGLAAGKLYHFRLDAANGSGTSPSSGLFATQGPGFGIKEFEVSFLDEDGAPAMQAGSHPDEMAVNIAFNTKVIQSEKTGDSRYGLVPDGSVRNIITDLPPGLVGDPNATPVKCTHAQLEPKHGNINGENDCPPESQVGVLEVEFGTFGFSNIFEPVYNMVAPHGVAAQVGGNFIVPAVFINSGIHAGGAYPLRSTVTGVSGVEPTITSRLVIFGTVGSGANRKAFLTLPTHCNGPLESRISVDSYQEPGHFAEAGTLTQDATGDPIGLTDCARLQFHPTFSVEPESNDASTPSGLTVGLHIPQQQISDPNGKAQSALRDTTVALPEGVAVNPSSANGLEGCSEALAGFEGMKEFHPDAEPGEKTATFTPDMPDSKRPGENFCPDTSKIGTVNIETPLLRNALTGGVYLAQPHDNPFGSLLAIYMFAEDEDSGTLVKLAGRVDLTASGQVVTTFENTPDLPFEDLKIHFFGGEKAPLVTPSTCGTFTTRATFTPWSGTGAVTKSPGFRIIHGPGGSACIGSAGDAPNHPTFQAGTMTPLAGSYSPFVLRLSRADGSQRFGSIQTTLPRGLLGRLAGVPYCPEAAIAAAAAKTGTQEQAAPSCPAASRVGSVNVGAGAGASPYYAQGIAYLAGPYKGAPVSLVVVTPAVAGPYDLGTVVVRNALYVNPATAQISTGSDPIPSILQGIPLDVRSIALGIDRPQFTLNPTSCEEMAVRGASVSALGQAAPLFSRFQVGGCRGLRFEPHLTLRLKGGTRRTKHPKLIATVYAKPGEANISRAQVKLPRSAFLDQAHIRTVCTRAQFAAGAGNGAHCPPGSVYGHAWAKSPLLGYWLGGNVYLRSSNHKLPDLVVALQGPASQPLAIDLTGRTDSVKGALRNTFEAVPDAPVSKFRLVLFGGKRGLVTNSRNLCAHRNRANVRLVGHSGKVSQLHPLVRNNCRNKPGKRRKLKRAARRNRG